MYETSEVAGSLGMHASAPGKRVKHLRPERHGKACAAIGFGSEVPVERWWT